MTDLPKALFISYDGLTDNLGRSQIIPYLNGISKQGISVHVISVDKPELYAKRKTSVTDSLAADVTWHPLSYHKSPPLLSTLWDLYHVEKLARRLIKSEGIRLIHVRSYPPMNLALRLKAKYGVKLLFDMRGFYADERIEGGIWSMDNLIHRKAYQKIKNSERRYFRESDHTVSLTYSGKAELQQQFDLTGEKITVIPCCADFEHFDHLRAKPGSDGLRLVYLGSLGTWYLIPELVRVFANILAAVPGSSLLVLTGDEPSSLYATAHKQGIPESNIRVQSAERSEIPELLAQADLSLFFIKESYSKKASSPTKLAELLSAGVPVICNKNVGDLARIADSYEAVEAIELDHIDSIDWAALLKRLSQLDPKSIRTQAMSEFHVEVAILRYVGIYRKLLA